MFCAGPKFLKVCTDGLPRVTHNGLPAPFAQSLEGTVESTDAIRPTTVPNAPFLQDQVVGLIVVEQLGHSYQASGLSVGTAMFPGAPVDGTVGTFKK